MQQGGTVTYTVQVPGALATKADGDGFVAYYEVYRQGDVDNADALPIYEGSEAFQYGSANIELEFVKNQKFVVLFWAQKEGSKVYDIEDLRNVSISKAQKLTSNNFDAEVFAGNDLVENCASTKGGNVVLSRPIAQLNIATDNEGLYLGKTQVILNKSYVKVTGLSATYNVYEGYGSNETANAAYGMADVPTGTVTVGTKPYTYVAMNYIGFMPQSDITVDVDFTIQTSEGNINHTVSNVPVKANYKTNIIGNLITATDDYTVTLSQQWEDEEYTKVVVSTAVDLQTEVNNIPDGETGVITLGGDIDFGNLVGTLTRAASEPASLVIPAAKAVILDLNGCTLSQTVEQTGAHSMIQNKGTLTIIDSSKGAAGKIAYGDIGNGGNYVSNTIGNSGKLVIESGLIVNNSSTTVAANGYPHPIDNSGELIINGGTLTNNANYSSMRIWCTTDDNTSVTINGGTFNGSIDFQTPSAAANKGSLTITGGTFNADTYTKCAVRLLGFGADVDEMLGDINGGTFNGEIALKNWSGAEFNSQVFYITGGQFSNDPTAFVVDGYPVIDPETEGGYYTIGQFVPVAKIGDQEYGSLRAAVAAAQDGATIILIKDIEQADGVIITDKKLTIDLNDKIFTVSEGANTNNRNFKINGSSVVTIKNGIMVAAGKYSSGAYGTVRTEGTANVTLKDVKLYNYRGNGLNVKALSGTTVTISDTEVYSQYGGGIESAGGTIELTNVKVEQKGMYTAPYNSMAISVNGGGTVTVISGTYSTECITAEDANNQGTSHGPWCAGVLNSGGTLIIKGGTFSNDNFGENTLATYARGLLLADTGANIQINGGTFNAVKSIIDIQNNLGDASKNPKATLIGGTYSSNPLTWEGLISVAEGYVVNEKDGKYVVVEYKPAAKVGTTEYGSIDEAIANWTNNTTLTLLADVTLTDVVTLKSTEHHILNLGTYTMTAASGKNAFVIQACGTGDAERTAITIKADTTTPGGINAGNKCIVYYKYADGGISGNDRPIIKIEGGVFTGSTSSFGTAGIYTIGTAARKCATLNITGGTFNCTINGSGKSKLLISGGTFNYSVSSQGDSTALRLIWGGKFKTLGFMTADANNTKFWFGSEMAKSNVGVYVDKDNYLVVGGPVITEPGDKFETEPKSYSSWSNLLQYSSAATYGLYYEKQ